MDAKTQNYPVKKQKRADGVVEEIIDWTRIDTPVLREGKKIVLPGDPEEMDYDVAIKTIAQVRDSEAQTYDVEERVMGLPWDAAVAMFRAMQDIYGVVLPTTMQTWFGPRNPAFLSVRTGHRDSDIIQVPVGQITLPGMKSECMLTTNYHGAAIAGKVNKRDRARLTEIAVLARKYLRTSSIYKGKAIKLLVDDDGDLDLGNQPEFFDVENVHETDMIHNDITSRIIETTILAPIKHAAECRKHRIPLKRGILLEGRYGCGKTLTARVTARVAVDNGWTFIILSRVKGLNTALATAKLYQPCVLFAEDIDRASADRSSKEATNDLINSLDGLVPAGSELMTVLTTNYVERIDRALLRPGRLDAVVSIDAPDAKTVAKLIRHYGSTNLPDAVPLERAGELLAGQIPATVAEVVKRAKLGMLTYGRSEMNEDDLVTAAESMKRHLALLDETPPEKSNGDKLEESLAQIFIRTDPGRQFAAEMTKFLRSLR
jgi:hypothetical protein